MRVTIKVFRPELGDIKTFDLDVEPSIKISDLRKEIVRNMPSDYYAAALINSGKVLNNDDATIDDIISVASNKVVHVYAEKKSISGGKRNKKSNRQRNSKKNRKSRRKV